MDCHKCKMAGLSPSEVRDCGIDNVELVITICNTYGMDPKDIEISPLYDDDTQLKILEIVGCTARICGYTYHDTLREVSKQYKDPIESARLLKMTLTRSIHCEARCYAVMGEGLKLITIARNWKDGDRDLSGMLDTLGTILVDVNALAKEETRGKE